MGSSIVFKPPYLDYSVAADHKLIQDKLHALAFAAMKRGGHGAATKADRVDQSLSTLLPDLPPPAKASDGQPSRSGTVRGFAAAPRKVASGKTVTQAFLKVSVAPSGVVPVGFNCQRTFTAYGPPASASVTHFVWHLYMQLQNQLGGATQGQILFMGGYLTDTTEAEEGVGPHITFNHDFSSYRTAAYTSTNKTAIFTVEVRAFATFDELEVIQSDPITLDFSVQSCLGIHSLAVEPTSIKGGDNRTEPVLTVALDGPAGPGGQLVKLRVRESGLGNIMGSGSFVIPQGQTSGQISWFLGSRKVAKKRTQTIIVELDSPSGHSGEAYVDVEIHP